jgi:predicted nucleotidyltransferase
MNLVRTLFSHYRCQVLALLLLRPDEHLHVREIARMTGLPAGSLHRELKLLTNAGLLVRQTVGNQVHYQANRNCPIFDELASIFRKTSGLADLLLEALLPLKNDLELAFVFGSMANGKQQTTSDIDVFIIGTVSFETAVQALTTTQSLLKREINPVVMTHERFTKSIEGGDRFISRIIAEPKIFIIGDSNDFGELTKNRNAENTRNGQE